MIKIAIIEDDKGYIEKMKEYIETYKKENNVSIQVDIFYDGKELVFEYEPIYDILLMDIEMPGMNGMDAAQEIREIDKHVIIIFITNMAQYALKGYQVRARSYILKPINYYSFTYELHEAIETISKRTEDTLLISGKNGLQKIPVIEITYLESKGHSMLIHTKGGELSIRESMKNMEHKLKDMHFARCNVSYLVNLAHVSAIVEDMVVIEEDKVPISRQKRKSFIAALTKYIGGGTNG